MLLLTVVLAGTYWYTNVAAVCRTPISYSIGELDSRFHLSESQARTAVSDAEAVWEDATGRNLFTYDPDASFKINFVYDERQQTTDTESVLRKLLDRKAEVNQDFESQYDELVGRYRELESEYHDQKAAYEQRLDAYNQKVDEFNQAGGAPPKEYQKLEDERKALETEEAELQTQVKKLNTLVDQINNIGAKGSELVDEYNQNVNTYNEQFGTEREFTQGDYEGNKINIYTFKNRNELVTVLAHEFGHALHLDHVDNEKSVMYYLMGGQTIPPGLTAEDLGEFSDVCGYDDGFWSKLRTRVSNLY